MHHSVFAAGQSKSRTGNQDYTTAAEIPIVHVIGKCRCGRKIIHYAHAVGGSNFDDGISIVWPTRVYIEGSVTGFDINVAARIGGYAHPTLPQAVAWVVRGERHHTGLLQGRFAVTKQPPVIRAEILVTAEPDINVFI